MPGTHTNPAANALGTHPVGRPTPHAARPTGAPQHNTRARAGWKRIRRAASELTPQTIEQIAQRVAQLLTSPRPNPTPTGPGEPALPGVLAPSGAPVPSGASPPVALLTAGQLAQQLGVTRAWVYENAHRLGAIRLGNGPRARLRFDPQTATEALNTPSPTPPAPQTRRPGRPRRRSEPTAPLLPVHEPRRRAILTRRLHTTHRHPTHAR
jgi:hypothetical protein